VTFHCQFVNNMSLCIVTLNVHGIAVVGIEKRKLILCVYNKHNVLLILNQNGKTEREGGVHRITVKVTQEVLLSYFLKKN